MRRGLRPTPCTVISEPGTSAAATRNGAADERSPGTSTLAERPAPSAGWTVALPGRRRTRAPARSSMRSVWSRVGAGSSTVVSPSSARSPARRTADLTCADATGSSYAMPWSRAPSTHERRVAVRRRHGRPHAAERLADPLHRPGGERRVSDRARTARSGPASMPASSRIERSRVPQSSGRADPARGAREGRRLARRSVSTSSSSTPAPSARTAAIVASVSCERPNPRDDRLPLAQRADQHRAVGDRLVPRHGDVAHEGGDGLDAHRRAGCAPQPSVLPMSATTARISSAKRANSPTRICCGPSQSASSGCG